MDSIERFTEPSGIIPHRGANGVTGCCQALPFAKRNKGKRFEEISPRREVERTISHNAGRRFPAYIWRSLAFALRTRSLPHLFKLYRSASPYSNDITTPGKVIAQAGGVRFGSAKSWRITVNELCNVHPTSRVVVF